MRKRSPGGKGTQASPASVRQHANRLPGQGHGGGGDQAQGPATTREARETGWQRAGPPAPWTPPSSMNPPVKHQTPAREARGESARGKAERLRAAVLSGCEVSMCKAQFSRHWERAGLLRPPAKPVNACSHSKLVNMFSERRTIFKFRNVFRFPSSMVRSTDFHKRRWRFINYLIFKN